MPFASCLCLFVLVCAHLFLLCFVVLMHACMCLFTLACACLRLVVLFVPFLCLFCLFWPLWASRSQRQPCGAHPPPRSCASAWPHSSHRNSPVAGSKIDAASSDVYRLQAARIWHSTGERHVSQIHVSRTTVAQMRRCGAMRAGGERCIRGHEAQQLASRRKGVERRDIAAVRGN